MYMVQNSKGTKGIQRKVKSQPASQRPARLPGS